ncbi:MAG: transposase [Candidatus Omnitrophica bacterium]|nr:transposase [Candidatus Omnitrophota bacterium]
MPYRKEPLIETEIYHIFTKSIAKFKVFNSDKDYERMRAIIDFYTAKEPPCKFSLLLRYKKKRKDILFKQTASAKIVKILAYCLMPTHIHLVLQQLTENGISLYANVVLKSYSKYFNIKHNRKGPLWEGRFKNVRVEDDEQFLHLTRYVHLNPTSVFLVDSPYEWKFSSYKEYIGQVEKDKKMCDFSDYLDMDIVSYEKFVRDRIGYQRELEKIKHLIME